MLSEEDIGMPVVRANNIENDKLDMSNNVKYWYVNDPQGADTLNYTISKNDVLINFINSENKMGTAAIVEKMPNRPTIYTTNILKMKLNDKCYNYYFLAYTHTKDYKEYIKGISKIAVNQASFTTVDFKNYCINIPSINEQSAIGEYFRKIDELITLHQRKLDKLINVKKSMLEKMFPKQGSTVPEIRFNGFTQAWEQREFSEMFDCTISNNTLSRSELSYEEGSILNIHYGDILIKYGSILDIHKYKIPRIPNEKTEDFRGSLLQPGDIVIADTAEDETTGKACEIGSLFGNSIVAGLHTMVARPNIEMASGYLGYYLNSNAYHCQLLPMMQGIKVLSLSRANVKKTALKFPESTKEQQLIANYFIQLDELITLHQRKLEKLKNIKKSMLEKMFV